MISSFHHLSALDYAIDFLYPYTWPSWGDERSFKGFEGWVEPGSIFLDSSFVFLVSTRILDHRSEMKHVDETETTRNVNRGWHSHHVRHARDSN